jgi:hypothetical protein
LIESLNQTIITYEPEELLEMRSRELRELEEELKELEA